MRKILVFDVGGTFIKYAIMDEEANFYEKSEVTTPLDSLDSFLNTIEMIYDQTKMTEDLSGIALSLPGNIDSETGQVYTPGTLTYNANVNIVKKIQERIPLKVTVENDGHSAALAELWKGKLKDKRHGAVLGLGTGIAGAFIYDRKLLKGNNFFAGEVSFMITRPDQPGIENCFAMKGSTTSLILDVAQRKQIAPEELNGRKIFQWIHEGDVDSQEALEELSKNIAVQIFNIQCFMDPETVLIGGGISKQSILIEKIKEQLRKVHESFPMPIPTVEVEACAFYNDSNLIGALYHYLNFNNE